MKHFTMYKNEECVISIVSWNSEKYLKKCIDACLAQTYPNCKVVVLDNNSNDSSGDIINAYGPSVYKILSKKNTGFSGGHNTVIRSFNNAAYYCILNPDVFLEKDYIEKCVGFLSSNANYAGTIGKVFQCQYRDGVYHNTNIIDTCGLGVKRSYQFFAIGTGQADHYYVDQDIFGVDGMCPVYRKEMFDDISFKGEYFDEYFFAYCEDQDLSWRAKSRGWQFRFLHEAIAFHMRTWQPGKLEARKSINKKIRRIALRNHYLMLIRNLSLKQFILALPFILVRLAKIIGYCILFEQYTLRAFGDVFIKFRRYYKMRNVKQ